MSPWGGAGSTVPYRICRSPVKGGATPLQLPAGSVVDLGASGIGTTVGATNFTLGAADLTILFSPTGAVASVNSTPVTNTIYLLIGKRERVNNPFTSGNTNETTFTNYQDLNNLWVTINPQTGLVNSEPVATTSAATADPAIAAARSLAAQSQGMGGK